MAKKKPRAYMCHGLPEWEQDLCRNVGPSYPVQTRHEYLRWVEACRKLYKKDPKSFYEMGCKREAHVPIPGGRLHARFPGSGAYPRDREHGGPEAQGGSISEKTLGRLEIGPDLNAPWPDHSQSLAVWELTQQRKAQSQLVTFEEAVAIEKGIIDYMMHSPEVAGGYGFRVPFTPEPLIASGMPPRAAYVLVERAADRIFLPPPESELSPEESEGEHSKFLWMATISPRLDYKNLGNVNLYDLPALLARVSRRPKRKGRRLKPLAKKNPSMFTSTSTITPISSRWSTRRLKVSQDCSFIERPTGCSTPNRSQPNSSKTLGEQPVWADFSAKPFIIHPQGKQP